MNYISQNCTIKNIFSIWPNGIVFMAYTSYFVDKMGDQSLALKTCVCVCVKLNRKNYDAYHS
jgi:hypothetical protein